MARKRQSRYRRSKRKSHTQPVRFAVSLIVLLLIFLCVIFYFHKRITSFFSKKTHVTTVKHHPSVAKSAENTPPSQPIHPPIHFEFYDSLPAMQVTPPTHTDTQASSEKIAKTVENPFMHPHYTLQIGVFNDEIAASQMQISLLLTGLDPIIVTKNEGSATQYLLQQGSFETFKAARTTQRLLQKKGILSTIQKIES